MASIYSDPFNLNNQSIQTHCSLCQEEVTATKDDVYICDQCGEHVTPQQPTASPANSNPHSILGSLLHQALHRTNPHDQPNSLDRMMESNSTVTPQMQARFQMLLPLFQQFMEGEVGQEDRRNIFGGLGGGRSGAPPAAKTAVDALERFTLDASNLRQVTQRLVVRVVPNATKNSGGGEGGDGHGDGNGDGNGDGHGDGHGSGEKKSDPDHVKQPPLNSIELVCEAASFGPAITSNNIVHCNLVVADPIALETEDVVNAKQMQGKVCVVKRGKCSFAVKVARAEQAGAVGVIVLNTVGVWPFTMGDSKREGDAISIPSVMCRQDHSEILLHRLKSNDQAYGVSIGVDEDNQCCAVCQCNFEIKDQVLRMPCPGFSHTFHEECIMPWLQLRNTCPSCRFELPTDDKAWDKNRNEERARASVDVNANYS